MSKRSPIPDPDSAAQKAAKLRQVMLSAISESDAEAAMKSVVERAKSGDLSAFEVMVKMIGNTQPSTVVNVNLEIESIRSELVKVLADKGSLRLSEIIKILELPKPQLAAVVDHEWFTSANGKVYLTPIGRAASLEE